MISKFFANVLSGNWEKSHIFGYRSNKYSQFALGERLKSVSSLAKYKIIVTTQDVVIHFLRQEKYFFSKRYVLKPEMFYI